MIETCWANNIDGAVNIGKIGNWYPAMQRHPNAEEQKLFAKDGVARFSGDIQKLVLTCLF